MKGRTALITGASRGIGAAIAARFRKAGARVVAPSRSELDLSSKLSIERYLRSLKGPVDVLVNNAGINVLGASTEIRNGEVEDVLQVNLLAPLALAAGVSEGMKNRKYGRILNISSIWSMVTRERRVSYTASKAAVNGLTRSLAVELAPYGVLVNALAPGYVDTELTRKNNSPKEIAAFEENIPQGRMGTPEEIAEAAAFLCSEANSYMTGQVVALDGGYTCK